MISQRRVDLRPDDGAVPDGRSAVTLTGSLRSIESWLSRLGRAEALQALRPGVSETVVRQSLAAAGLDSVPPLEALYAWHDGTELPASGLVDDLEILPGFYFLGLDAAIAERARYLELGAWESGWFPVLADGGGWFSLVDLGGEAEPVVRRWELDDPTAPVAFDSIAALATTIEQAYVRGIFFVDPRGHLEMDDTQFADLAVELSPATSAAWEHGDHRAGDGPPDRQPPEHPV
jgi:cell wall assembly regulator SMI1